MAAYVIADVEIIDQDGYREYSSQVPETLRLYGGRFLARGGPIEVLEGDRQPKRIVVIEFATIEQARDWYTSPEYQKILPVRKQNAHSSVILVDGV